MYMKRMKINLNLRAISHTNRLDALIASVLESTRAAYCRFDPGLFQHTDLNR